MRSKPAAPPTFRLIAEPPRPQFALLPPKPRPIKMESKSALAAMQQLETRSDEELAGEFGEEIDRGRGAGQDGAGIVSQHESRCIAAVRSCGGDDACRVRGRRGISTWAGAQADWAFLVIDAIEGVEHLDASIAGILVAVEQSNWAL